MLDQLPLALFFSLPGEYSVRELIILSEFLLDTQFYHEFVCFPFSRIQTISGFWPLTQRLISVKGMFLIFTSHPVFTHETGRKSARCRKPDEFFTARRRLDHLLWMALSNACFTSFQASESRSTETNTPRCVKLASEMLPNCFWSFIELICGIFVLLEMWWMQKRDLWLWQFLSLVLGTARSKRGYMTSDKKILQWKNGITAAIRRSFCTLLENCIFFYSI